MDYFTVEGTWWVPSGACAAVCVQPESDSPLVDPTSPPDGLPTSPFSRHEVPGALTFDDDGLKLVVYGQLEESTRPDEQEVVSDVLVKYRTVPIVLGRIRDGWDLTLFDVSGDKFDGYVGSGEIEESYRAKLALFGFHADTEQFGEAMCEFDFLDAWTDRRRQTANPVDSLGAR